MEKQQIKELLEFMLNSFRAQLAVQAADSSQTCPFDFQNFLQKWKSNTTQTTGQLLLTLNSVVAQGLLDSICPYLVSALGQTQIGSGVSRKSSHSTLNQIVAFGGQAREKSREKEIVAQLIEDCEIIIHVCDETRGVKEDFQFQQSVLTKEMKYFTQVAVKGQRLRDLDISVHCDLSVFDWLIKWIRAQGQGIENSQRLDSRNVVGIVVSAEFLQMPILVSQCLDYLHENIEQVINHSPNLSCLSESLVRKLAGYFRHTDLENRVVKFDRTDRITSRLFIQHIIALNFPSDKNLDFMSPNPTATTESLFRCEICGQLLTNSVAAKILCVDARLDSRGRFYSTHVKDEEWNLRIYLRDLKRELKSWRRVFWRLWGTVNFFRCGVCNFYFPGRALETCRYHPDLQKLTLISIPSIEEKLSYARMSRNFSTVPKERDLGATKDSGESVQNPKPQSSPERSSHPYKKYPCCPETFYKFSPHPRMSGCEKKEHVAYNELEENWYILLTFRELISQDEPEQTVKLGDQIQLRPLCEQTPKDLMMGSTSKPSPKYSIFMRAPLMTRTGKDSSSTESDESSGEGTTLDGGIDNSSTSRNARRIYSQIERNNYAWTWNSDLSTRYNQDMQREREEIYMVNLAATLVQRIPLESSKFQFLRRRAPKENVGGSFIKLEQDFLS